MNKPSIAISARNEIIPLHIKVRETARMRANDMFFVVCIGISQGNLSECVATTKVLTVGS